MHLPVLLFSLSCFILVCFNNWQVTVPHVDAEFFCLLEKNGFGSETERNTSLALVKYSTHQRKKKKILIRLINKQGTNSTNKHLMENINSTICFQS